MRRAEHGEPGAGGQEGLLSPYSTSARGLLTLGILLHPGRPCEVCTSNRSRSCSDLSPTHPSVHSAPAKPPCWSSAVSSTSSASGPLRSLFALLHILLLPNCHVFSLSLPPGKCQPSSPMLLLSSLLYLLCSFIMVACCLSVSARMYAGRPFCSLLRSEARTGT